ncbi:DUF5123 domain-containing protein [uncultured Bacteroides sp.]|uniref:DUF5123 domain-containing protein n=1 Tax=uncultured Bacteroides sp. TaxID=162156 RepID=UPI002633B769|nr:DUF5123 domain-containing protein [uncultured Bacteroides sp.]
MKNIKSIIGTGVIVLLASLNFTSCTDGNDWKTDSAFDRLFGTKQSSFSVAEGAISAEVTWESTPDTKYYIIEASTDSLFDAKPMGEEGSIVYGEDGSIIKSPYTITGLMGETTYYLRIKSVNETKESHWVYLTKFKFTTDKEQIFNDVDSEDITDESVHLTWQLGLEVTHIEYVQDGELVTREIAEDEKKAGAATVSDLSAVTEYTFYIYNGDILRGEMEVTTNASVMVESKMEAIGQNSATFSWDASVGRLTGYYFAKGDAYPQTANNDLDEEMIANHKLTLNGLEPNTVYTVAVMRNNTVRAMQTFKTAMGVPSDFVSVSVSTVDEWNAAVKNTDGKLAIILSGELDLTNGGTVKIPTNVTSLMVMGGTSVTDDKPVLKTKGLSFLGDMDDVEFFNLNLLSNGSTNNYIFDFNGVTSNIKSFVLTSCNVDEARGVFRLRSGSTGVIEKLLIEDCRIFNIGSYGLCAVEGATYGVASLEMNNTTYVPYAGQSGAMVKSKYDGTMDITFNQCTFYGFTYAILDNQNKTTMNVSVRNTLMGKIGKKRKFFSASGTMIECTNLFITSDCSFESSIGETTLDIDDNALFANPAEFDFTVKAAEYVQYGDQYWNK